MNEDISKSEGNNLYVTTAYHKLNQAVLRLLKIVVMQI